MDATDFGSIYQRYAADVFRFALHLCGNRPDAEDILSETFIRAWTSPAGIRVGTVKAYLLMIARNLHLDRVRVAGRTAVLEIDSPDSAPGPETTAVQRDEVRALRSALARLPERERAALLMRGVGDLTYDVIGAALGMSPGAARVTVHRARIKLAGLRARAGEHHEDHT
ncbi:MAG: sigma-70 family RNA polymerase sigma factor [Acidobacteriota bacterium]